MEDKGPQERRGSLESQEWQGREGLMDKMELKDVKGQEERKVNTELYYSTTIVVYSLLLYYLQY